MASKTDDMQITVIIPTLGRPGILMRALQYLEEQDRLPSHVIVSAPDDKHVPDWRSTKYRLSYVFGGHGLSAQRNVGLELALPNSDIVTFFDDDFLPARNYLAQVARCFEAHDDISVLMGHVVVDGARGPGLTFDEGIKVMRATELSWAGVDGFADQPGAYGCNMSIRASHIGTLRFDERLALYGWQEDIDFTCQLKRHGRVTKLMSLFGIHLGFKAGRVSGVKLGYSQVVNPTYLIMKGTIPRGFAIGLIARNVTANLLKSLWPEPYVDRSGRLKGNLIGAFHLARGRIEPEHVLKMSP